MAKRTIAIDIDDVIADSTDALRLIVNERTGLQLTHEHYMNVGGEYWGYYERVWEAHGVAGKVTFEDLSNEMAEDQSHVEFVAGAQSAVRQLSEKFHIIFITARDKSWEGATRKWFNERFASDDIELYFCESHKESKSKTKGQLCKQFGAMWLIDDNVEHCKTAVQEDVQAILFGEYGWQRDIPKTMKRCSDWPDVLRYLEYAA